MAARKLNIGLPAAIISGLVLLLIGASAGAGLLMLIQKRDAAPVEIAGSENAAPMSVAARLPSRPYGKWTLNCERPKDSKEVCALMLTAVSQDRKRMLLRLAATLDNGGVPSLTIVTPPNANMTNGITLTPETGAALKAPFSMCAQGFCRAIMPMDATHNAALARSKTVKVSYTAGGGENISYPLPVDGFSDGLAALQARAGK